MKRDDLTADGRAIKAPWMREDGRHDVVPPPGHSRCGGAKVAGFRVDQEDWDAIFGETCDECGNRLDRHKPDCATGRARFLCPSCGSEKTRPGTACPDCD